VFRSSEVAGVPRLSESNIHLVGSDRVWSARAFGSIVSMLLLVGITGCVDGPLFALKRMNPYYQSQWKEDEEKGAVFRQRQSEMRLIRSQIASMSPDEQERWSKIASEVFDQETSQELRREIVMAMEHSPHADAESVLIKACSDKNDKVRLAACKALANRSSETASKMLATVAQTDKTMSVRLAAIRALGTYRTDDAKSLLRRALDEKSPAIQYEATVALKTMTGRDFNGEVELWRQFLDGQPIEEPTTSFTEKIAETVGLKR
jgi:hypothetical protein